MFVSHVVVAAGQVATYVHNQLADLGVQLAPAPEVRLGAPLPPLPAGVLPTLELVCNGQVSAMNSRRPVVSLRSGPQKVDSHGFCKLGLAQTAIALQERFGGWGHSSNDPQSFELTAFSMEMRCLSAYRLRV